MFGYLFTLIFSLLAFAEPGLVEWRPAGFDYSFVLPQKEGESPRQAVNRYLQAIKKNPELKEFSDPLQAAGTGQVKPLKAEGPLIVALANEAHDLAPEQRRMRLVLDPLKARGTQAVVAPVAVTEGLSEAEAQAFRKKISREFDGLIAVGGDDIHPSLYGDPDPKGLAKTTNLSRDRHELELVRSYLDEGKGMFSGICRGHQMGGVASSCSLVKDIREELTYPHPSDVDHAITIQENRAGRLSREIFDGNSVITVNSYHHQAVQADPANPRIRVTAVASSQPKITEMAEYYNGRGLSVQFHPEMMTSSAIHARFYDVLYGEVDKAHRRRVSAPLRRINPETTLFGVEYTFQDQGMVDEPGRLTFETPHKRAKFERFKQAYISDELGLDTRNVEKIGEQFHKPGIAFEVPGDGKYVMDMEPVTIEVNTTPKRIFEIEEAAEKIYRASRKADLVPYVNPAAERSGMGHIHVGGRTLADSPFYQNPHLLRNMMVYLHKHPSVLWGFAEAYDIGANSNIETYHDPKRQAAFGRAVEKFDNWYKKAKAGGEDLSDGLRQFLRFLQEENSSAIGFFEHYRFMNLEHLKRSVANSPGPVNPNLPGKATVEFRNFRPPKTPQHAKAHAEFLMALMERLSDPNHLEPFESISPAAYNRFHSATRVAADWEVVKRDLPLYNPLWDDSVGEYVQRQTGIEAIRAKIPGGVTAEIFPAYSRKDDKGTKFELRIPVEGDSPPSLRLGATPLEFEQVRAGGKAYWVSVFDADGNNFFGLSPKVVGRLGRPATCAKWFQAIP